MAASPATAYDTYDGNWPAAALAMYNPPATRTSSAVRASHRGWLLLPRGGGSPAAGAVARPHRKHTMALSDISVPHCWQITRNVPEHAIIYFLA